jgi:hypothetical protein
MGWPSSEEVKLSIVKVDGQQDAKITLLGYQGQIKWKINGQKQPVISVPNLAQKDRPCEYAYVFKLTGFETSLNDY